MKNFRMVCVAAVLTLGVSVAASAADRAVSKAGLNKMGLGSMSVLSDKEGVAVRGKGSFAFAAGSASSQLFNGPVSTGIYAAGASHNNGTSSASGSAISVTGVGASIGPFSGFVVGGAFTASSASAK
jgi:hypothetical protein